MALVVEWTETEYGTGVDIADKEHQKLFDIINRLSAAKYEHAQSQGEKHLHKLRSLFEELKDYTHYHFEHEERLFVATSYPNTACHVSQHRKFTVKLHEAERTFADSNQFPQSMLEFLVKWLSIHIKSMDREYAHYLGPSQDTGLSGVFFNCLRYVATQHSSEKAFVAALDKVQRNGNWTAGAAGGLIAAATASTTSATTSSSSFLSISDTATPRLTSFDSSRRYPELLFYQLLERVARTIRMAEADILSEVGVYFVKSMSPHHLQMLGTRFPEAIRRLNHLHSTIKVLPAFAQICPPTFRCVEKTSEQPLSGSRDEDTSSSTSSQRSLTVYYTPARDSRMPLLPFAAGALKGLAQLCGIRSLHVITVSIVPNANKEYELLAQWSSDHGSDDEPLSEPLTLKLSAHVRLDPESLIQLFPFHFGLKKDGRVCQIGPSLAKLVPSLKRSSDPNQSIAICHPTTCSGPLVVPKILGHSSELFWLSVKSTKKGTAVPLVVMMRGEFVRARDRTRTNSKTGKKKKSFVLVFCGEPIFSDMESVQACGLDLSDFALNSEISALMAPALPVHQITSREAEHHTQKPDAPVKTRKLLLGLRAKAARTVAAPSADDGDLEVELPNNNLQVGPSPISVLSDCLFRDRFSQFSLSMALLRLSVRTPNGTSCIDALLTFYTVVGGVFDLLQSLLEREFRVGSDTLFRVDSPQIKAVLIFFARSGETWRHDTITAMQKACNDPSSSFDVTAAALACLMICSEQIKRIPPSIGHLLQWVHSKTLASFKSPVLADQAVVNLLFLRFLLPQMSTDMGPTAKNCLKVAKAIQQSAASSQTEGETNPLQSTLNQIIRSVIGEQFSTWEQVGAEPPTKFGTALATVRDFILQNYDLLNEDFDFRPCLAEIGRAALARSIVSR